MRRPTLTMEEEAMEAFIKAAQEAVELEEVQQAARVLAKYNLGICVPHIHDQRTGALSPLPTDLVACERDLKISFAHVSETANTAIAVAWRWNRSELEVCANCCGPSAP